MLILVKLLAKYVVIIYALSSASESKSFQSRSTVEIPGRARREERLSPFQIEQESPKGDFNWAANFRGVWGPGLSLTIA